MSSVKELPLDDRPREKLKLRGANSLSDSELLAILLRTGKKGRSVIEVAQDLISEFNDVSVLASKSIQSLQKISGIGQDKAATLVAAFELSRRIEAKNKWKINKKITSPDEIARMFIPILRDEVIEKFLVVVLGSSNKIANYKVISEGSLNSSVVHPREVFKFAVENDAASIILIHNHPSGNLEPSREDISITKKIVESGKMMDIPVFDHIIIGGNNYSSFVEKRLL